MRVFEIGRTFDACGAGLSRSRCASAAGLRRCAPEQWGLAARTSISSTSRATSRRWPRRAALTTSSRAASGAASRTRGAIALSTAAACGWIGELHPRLVRTSSCRRRSSSNWTRPTACHAADARGKPVSRLPVVRRDLALVVDEDVPVQALLDALAQRTGAARRGAQSSSLPRQRARQKVKKALRFLCLCRILTVL